MNFTGTSGNDSQAGTAGDDVFNFGQGGHDVLTGLEGDDLFKLGATLDAHDRIDGGTGADTLFLAGDYSAGVTFASATISGIETLRLGAGFDYLFTLANGNVEAGQVMLVDAHVLGAGDSLVLDGHREKHGMFSVWAGAGDDSLTGGDRDDTFNLSRGGADYASGGGGDDTFLLGKKLTAADHIDGGDGLGDTVVLQAGKLTFQAATMVNVEALQLLDSAGFTLTMDDGNVAAGKSLTVDASALSANHVLHFDGSAETDAGFSIVAGAGNDVLTGGSGADSFDLSHGGADRAGGGGDDDLFAFGAAWTSRDRVDGGGGVDTIELDGGYAGGLALTGAMTTAVEKLKLDAGHDYDLTALDGSFSSGQATIDAGSLGASDSLAFDGSARTGGGFFVIGGAGDDVIVGSQSQDAFDLSQGGDDTVQHGGGDLVNYYYGAAFSSGDTLIGSDNLDEVQLSGDYSAPTVLSGANLVKVDSVRLFAGNSYDLVLADGVAADHRLVITGQALGSSDSLTVDTTQDAADTVWVTGGAGDDQVIMASDYVAAHSVLRGNGGDDTLSLAGDFSTDVNFNIYGFETVLLGAGFDYSFTLSYEINDSGAGMLIDGHALGAGDSISFNGSLLLNSVSVTGGAGDDHLSGGALADVFDLSKGGSDTVSGGGGDDLLVFGGSYTSADVIDGGDGAADTIQLDGDYSGAKAQTLAASAMARFERLMLGDGYSYEFTTADNVFSTGSQVTIDGGALSSSVHLDFDAAAETATSFSMIGGAGRDALQGGDGADDFDLSKGGRDTVDGGGGDDHFYCGSTLTSADRVDGGVGDEFDNDTVEIMGAYTGAHALVLGATTMVHIETLKLDAGFDYDITLNAATIQTSATLTVDRSDLAAGQDLRFDGSAVIDGHVAVSGGAGDDTIIGGHAADGLTGGEGADTFVFSSASDDGRPDLVSDADFDSDSFQFALAGGPVQGIDAAVTSGTLTDGDFRSDLAAIVGAGELQAHHAVLVTASSGDLAGHTYLVVDADGAAGYTGGADYVIEVTGYTGTLDVGDFG